MTVKAILCLSLAIIYCSAAPITKERLRFQVSAKGLPDKDDVGTIDPYVEVFYSEAGNTRETKIGRSETISDNENPDWGNIFEFDFDRNKQQKWHFKIWDQDNLREDDKGGQVYVDVTDYVDKGQLINANLDKKGYITVKSVDPQPQQRTGQLPGQLPYAPGSPDSGVLTFRVAANNLPDKDKLGKTDPYVEIWYTNGLTGKKVKVGRSTTLSGTKNPNWGESFTFNWDRSKDQRWFFKIYDNDNFREDDTVGKGWLEVNDYVAHGQVMTINLNKKGTLTVTRADGQPPNPYDPVALQSNTNNPFPQSPVVLAPPISPNRPGFVAPQRTPGIPSSPPVPQNTHNNNRPLHEAVAPIPVSTKYPMKLRFKLSGNNFPDEDIIGTSDPYVKVFITQDGSGENLLKKGTKLSDNENPQWPDIFEFNYDPSKHQKLRFLILDEDDNRRDDEIGDVIMEADELEQKHHVTLKLSKGTLTVTKI